MMRKVISLLLMGLAVGCSIGPNYRRPAIDVPQSWTHREAFSTADGSTLEIADTAWWELFGDPVLTDMIKDALAHNNDVRIAAARVEQYMGMYGVAISDFFPKFGGNISGSYGRSATIKNSHGTWPTKSNFSVSVSTGWEIDIWGKIRRANEAARADLLSAEEARRGIVLLITSQVAASYIQLLSLDRQLEIARQTAESRQKSLDLFKLRRARGDISDLVLSQLESEYWYTQSWIPVIEKNISQIEHALSVLLGRNPGSITRGLMLSTLKVPVVPEGIPSVLLERRPDVRQAEEQLIAANARIGVAKSQYFPAISLTGAFGVASGNLTSLFTPGSIIFNVGGNLLQPIFRAGEIRSQVRASEAVQKQALFAYVRTVQTAFQDTEDALVDRSRTFEQYTAEGKRVNALNVYARLARLRYNEGLTSYLEVLDAERSLFAAQLDHAQTHAQLLNSIVHIYRALAGGWLDRAAAAAYQPDHPADAVMKKDREKRMKNPEKKK
jgi:outer membrane protein, multidrug efflux system